MLQERIEPARRDAFDAVLRRCALQAGDMVAILGETQSRPVLMELAAGTALAISLQGAVAGGNWGSTSRPGVLTHWPGGLVLAFPADGSVNGTLVRAEGDVNLIFKHTIERPIVLTNDNDHITRIEGRGVDAEQLRSFAGNFLYSTGANESAGRYTRGHFDWPLRDHDRVARRHGRGRHWTGDRMNGRRAGPPHARPAHPSDSDPHQRRSVEA